MKKSNKLSENITKGTRIVVAASMLSAPMLFQPSPMLAQKAIGKSNLLATSASSQKMVKIIKFWKDSKSSYSIVGLDNGHTIYKNAKGEYFYLEPNTGDMKTLSADVYNKFSNFTKPEGKFIKMQKVGCCGYDKFYKNNQLQGSLTILGVDDKGNVIQQNSRNEKFYLDPYTGDMIFVKTDK